MRQDRPIPPIGMGGFPEVHMAQEPRVHRRFWAAMRRARYAAAQVIAGAGEAAPPERFLLRVPPGIGFNVTSSGTFLVGHAACVVTYLCTVSCTR